MTEFDKLLAELNTLDNDADAMSKALSADAGADDSDDKIQGAASDTDGDGDVDGNDGDGDADDDKDGDDDEDEQMGKSFLLTLENGEEVEAFDGTKMLKSLQARLTETENNSVKALQQAVALGRKQGEMLKSLQETVAKLQAGGRGRKSVVSVNDGAGVADMKKSQEVTGQEFMKKAMTAMNAGLITGTDISRIEAYMNKGMAIPQDLVGKVLQ